MEYSNPKIPEGINVSSDNPLKDFFYMLAGVGLTVIFIVVLLSLLAEQLVRFIPFEVELSLSERFQNDQNPEVKNLDNQRIEGYLQALTDELVSAQKLPEGMVVTVHYVDKDEVNAFATLGGHVLIFRGLLENLSSENTLSMVLAHEIAHIKHRDPMIALGRGLTVGIAIMSVVGVGDGAISQQLVGQIGLLTALGFSRDQEMEADAEALQTLQNYYGHASAAEDIFKLFMREQAGLESPAFLSTHPLNKERIDKVMHFVGASTGSDNNTSESSKKNTINKLPEWWDFH